MKKNRFLIYAIFYVFYIVTVFIFYKMNVDFNYVFAFAILFGLLFDLMVRFINNRGDK